MSQPFDKYEKLGAYHWDWYQDPNYAWYKECVDRCVEFCKGPTLDIGCGDGVIQDKLPLGSFGVDNSEKALDLSPVLSGRTMCVDLNNCRLDYIMDYVCCLNTIEHLETPAAILQAVRLAKKGAIIITDKATRRKGRYHEHEYTKQELLDTFKEFKPKYFEINSTEFGKPITFIGVEVRK